MNANISKKCFYFGVGVLLVLAHTVDMVKVCVCAECSQVFSYLLQYFYGAEYFSVIADGCLFYELMYNYHLLGLMVMSWFAAV